MHRSDEKIKVSSRKHPFIIDHYLLGHTEFVSKIVVDEENDSLFSSGGDGTVRSWKNGKAMNVKEHEDETVCHSLVVSDEHLQYASVSFEENKESFIRTVGVDLCDKASSLIKGLQKRLSRLSYVEARKWLGPNRVNCQCQWVSYIYSIPFL